MRRTQQKGAARRPELQNFPQRVLTIELVFEAEAPILIKYGIWQPQRAVRFKERRQASDALVRGRPARAFWRYSTCALLKERASPDGSASMSSWGRWLRAKQIGRTSKRQDRIACVHNHEC